LTVLRIVLGALGVIGLLLVPGFVWAAGLGLDGGTVGDWLIFYAFMLAVPLGASLALLAPAMAVSREWRGWVAFVLLAYVGPVSVLAAWPVGSLLIGVEVGGVPAALGLFFLASCLRRSVGQLRSPN
jgi:hypothetical protein